MSAKIKNEYANRKRKCYGPGSSKLLLSIFIAIGNQIQ